MIPASASVPIASVADMSDDAWADRSPGTWPNPLIMCISSAARRHADAAADQGEERALQEELSSMLRLVAPSALRRPISRVRSLTATSMMLTMPIAPSAKRHQPDAAEKDVHRVEDLAHGLRALDRVPILEGVFVVPVEAVVAGDDPAHFVARQRVLVAHPRLIVDERNRLVLIFPFSGKNCCMVREWQ